MSYRHHIVLFTAMLLLAMPLGYVAAQVMESGSYQIQLDSINFAGGRGTSTSYTLEDTLGETGTGNSTSTNYALGAGYQQNFEQTYITLSAVSDVTLPAIGGITGGVGTGSSTWLVTTNNAAGYSLVVQASTEPALKSGSVSFGDYAPGGPDPDYTFAVASSDSAFGFSPEGVDVIQRFKDNGSACNAGTANASDKCWDGFSTTTKAVSTRNSANDPSGSTTTLKYRVESGSAHIQPAGDYAATITVTAVTL